jgi:hypothetical protein
MPTTSFTHQSPRLIGKPELYRFVSITIYGFDLQNMTWARFDHSDRNGATICLEYLCHTDLAAENTFAHLFVP